MILIYTKHLSNRCHYIFKLIFEDLLGVQIKFTSDVIMFKNSDFYKINYSPQPISTFLFFKSTSLLFETDLVPQNIEVQICKNHPAFFFHHAPKSALPFDVFAMLFYLVSRYEEYTATQKDAHQRFEAHQSLAFQHHFLDKPLVNQWVMMLQDILSKHFPTLIFKKNTYQFTPTYDIDYAWAYLHKGFWRSAGAWAKALFTRSPLLMQRLKVQLRQIPDPYFTFDYLDALHAKLMLQPIYFFLVGKHGEYDKNISIHKKVFQRLIAQLANRYTIGLHPSYQSNTDFEVLKTEHQNLEKVARQPITQSRQHFLKLDLPTTYQRAIRLGIQREYTMGYAAELGFRASIATPFPWFDLVKNEATNLEIVPFQLMDVTLKNYLKCSPAEAMEKAQKIIEVTKSVNGHLVTIFHNNSLSEQEGWEGWRAVFETILENGRGENF